MHQKPVEEKSRSLTITSDWPAPSDATSAADEVICVRIDADEDGRPLHGGHAYVLHFERSQEPPARGYWSLAMYNDRHLPVDNAIRRYSIGDRNELKLNEDGSLDLFLQHRSPGRERESNWLPAPENVAFALVLSIQWPLPDATSGRWQVPALRRVPPASGEAVRSSPDASPRVLRSRRPS